MEKNTEILNELKTISPLLAEIPRVNVQSVPSGYFENLEERISIFSLLNQEQTLNPLTKDEKGIPAGYFENLPGSILSKVKEMEGRDEYFPILNSLKNKHVFQIPEGYFENLSYSILSKIHPVEKAKVISITGKTWWKYMAAALIAGLMLVSTLYFVNTGSKNDSTYLAAAKEYQTNSQFEKGIASLKDDDIIAFLETHGNITDNDILLNNINTNGLPTEIDYLVDDNALNNYLNKIHSENK